MAIPTTQTKEYMMTITTKDLITKVRELAQARPDFRYLNQGADTSETGCSYLGRSVHEPNVGEACIFGQAFVALGVHRETLEVYEMEFAGEVLKSLFPNTVMSEEEYGWVSSAQATQDDEATWGEAIANADKNAPFPIHPLEAK